MPNPYAKFGQYDHEIKNILTVILPSYSRTIYLSLLAKKAFGDQLSELEEKQLVLYSQIQLGQFTFTRRERFMNLLKNLLEEELNVGLFEWEFLREIGSAQNKALENEESLDVFDINNSVMPTFYDKILEIEYYCAVSDFNSAINSNEPNNKQDFVKLQNDTPLELKLQFLNSVKEVYNSLLLLNINEFDM